MAKQQDVEPPNAVVTMIDKQADNYYVAHAAIRQRVAELEAESRTMTADLNKALQDLHAATADPSPEREQPETTEACSVCGGGGIVFAATGEPGKRKCPCCRGTGVVGKRPQEA